MICDVEMCDFIMQVFGYEFELCVFVYQCEIVEYEEVCEDLFWCQVDGFQQDCDWYFVVMVDVEVQDVFWIEFEVEL